MSFWEAFWDIFWISKTKELPDAGNESSKELERTQSRVLA